MNHRTVRLGRLLLTTCRQGAGAPFADDALMFTDLGKPVPATAFVPPWRLRPWRCVEVGTERQVVRWQTIEPGRALVVGWSR